MSRVLKTFHLIPARQKRCWWRVFAATVFTKRTPGGTLSNSNSARILLFGGSLGHPQLCHQHEAAYLGRINGEVMRTRPGALVRRIIGRIPSSVRPDGCGGHVYP